MSTVYRKARVQIEERSWVSGTETFSGATAITHPAGNPLQVDFFLTRSNNPITDAGLTAITVSVLDNVFDPSSYADVTSGGFDTTVTTATWQTGTKQSATVTFTGTQLELSIPNGQESQNYVLVVYANDYTVGFITLTIVRDGVPAGALPVQSGNIVPGGDSYDGSGHYTLNVISGTFYIIAFGAHDASVDNGSDNYTDSLHVFQAAGSTVLLHGTASATVTAIVRPNPVVTTAVLQAMITAIIGVASGTLSGAGSPEGVQTGAVGNTYLDTTGNAFYSKKTGSGNTGWQMLIQL